MHSIWNILDNNKNYNYAIAAVIPDTCGRISRAPSLIAHYDVAEATEPRWKLGVIGWILSALLKVEIAFKRKETLTDMSALSPKTERVYAWS